MVFRKQEAPTKTFSLGRGRSNFIVLIQDHTECLIKHTAITTTYLSQVETESSCFINSDLKLSLFIEPKYNYGCGNIDPVFCVQCE